MFAKRKIRQGITLIEVLAAIAVASIGVFGVLVLVPLASRMSQIGFSNEAARSNSTNVLAKAKSFGAFDYSQWVYLAQTWPAGATPRDVLLYSDASAPASHPTGAVCVDPMMLANGINSNVFPFTFGNSGQVDLFSVTGEPTSVTMPRVTVAREKVNPPLRMGTAVAQEFVSEANSVRLQPALSDVTQPMQKYMDDPGVGRIKREVSSSKSSFLLLLPNGGPSSLVYRAISLTLDGRQFINNAFDRTFDATLQNGDPLIRADYGLLDLYLQEAGHDTTSTIAAENLPSGGWVLMVPYTFDVNGNRIGDWRNAVAYEILSSDFATQDPAGVAQPQNGHQLYVTLVGPPYLVPDGYSGSQVIYVPGTVDIHEMEVRLGIE